MDRQLDKWHFTTLCPGSQYFPLAIDSRHVNGLYDSGSNVTIISHRLAKALGLQILTFNRTFYQVAGHLGYFVGRLGPIPLKFHDWLQFRLTGIRVMESCDSKLALLLGTDLFSLKSTSF